MLTSISNRVPSREELEDLDGAIARATSPVQHLEMSLRRIADGSSTVAVDLDLPESFAEPFTAEQAWHLTHLADNMEQEAEHLKEWAASIKNAVRTEWLEQQTADDLVRTAQS